MAARRLAWRRRLKKDIGLSWQRRLAVKWERREEKIKKSTSVICSNNRLRAAAPLDNKVCCSATARLQRAETSL